VVYAVQAREEPGINTSTALRGLTEMDDRVAWIVGNVRYESKAGPAWLMPYFRVWHSASGHTTTGSWNGQYRKRNRARSVEVKCLNRDRLTLNPTSLGILADVRGCKSTVDVSPSIRGWGFGLGRSELAWTPQGRQPTSSFAIRWLFMDEGDARSRKERRWNRIVGGELIDSRADWTGWRMVVRPVLTCGTPQWEFDVVWKTLELVVGDPGGEKW